jgi:hypothetical protein
LVGETLTVNPAVILLHCFAASGSN